MILAIFADLVDLANLVILPEIGDLGVILGV